MSTEALRQHLATADPFGEGYWGPDQIALGFHALAGRCPYPSGAVALMRRRLYPAAGDWDYCGTAKLSGATISQAAAPHEVDMGYQYAAAALLGNGYVSEKCQPVRVDFDSNRDIISPALPMWPKELCVRPAVGGRYILHWAYDEWGEGTPPSDFAVFEGATAETVDYDTPIGTVTYVVGRNLYEFTSGQYSGGTSHVFAVRARNSNSVCELNTFTSDPTVAEAGTPASATISLASTRQAGG